ncbi:type I glyceraldehyde-3-phosphate dehydrogenase [Burkholderiaceae bacterium DAT-1]|nr:type I glyceraldehyde-3-phosphate dehydrogenase [Burkholderiaceae bacterium DAT-1]
MSIRIAINGYGRIGRNVLRAIYELNRNSEFKIVAINASGDIETNAHLTKFDTVHGRFNATVKADGDWLRINDENIRFFSTRNPAELPWRDLGIDVVLECTGAFTSKAKCQVHLDAGAKKVLISAPGDKDVDATIVYGVNHDILRSDMTVVSNASCTTNCLAPVAKVLNDAIGIEKGLMTTIHAYTNDQVLTDVRHKDLRRARSATQSIIPTKTGAAAAVGLVLPELNGKLDGYAMRVPTINVSMVDLSFVAKRDTSKEEINALMRDAANGLMKGVLGYNDLPLVSIDFNHTNEASIFDSTLTKVSSGNLVKVGSWYDNEWGFSVQMLNTARAMMAAK